MWFILYACFIHLETPPWIIKPRENKSHPSSSLDYLLISTYNGFNTNWCNWIEGRCLVHVQPDAGVVHGRIRHSCILCRTHATVRFTDTAVWWLSNSSLRRSDSVPWRIANTRPERRVGSNRHQYSGSIKRLRRLRLRSESIAGVQSGHPWLSFPWGRYGTRAIHPTHAGHVVRFRPYLFPVSAKSQPGWISSFTQSGWIRSNA